MTTTFTGEVRIPGAIENGLPSTITLDAQTLILTAGGTELGRWNRTDLALSRDPDGTFRLTLGSEIVLFNPDSPLEFAILSGMPATASPPVGTPSGPVIPAPTPTAAPLAEATAAAPPVAAPGPSPDAPPPAPAAAVAPPPAVAVPPTVAPPPPAVPLPTGAASPTPVPPVASTPPAVAPTQAAAPPVATPTAQPPVDVVAAGAAAAAAARATAPAQPAAPAGPADIRLETDSGQEAVRTSPSLSNEFWDGFYAEEEEAAAGSEPDPLAVQGEVVDTGESQFHLESAAETGDDEATDASKVTGFGSGLITEDDETSSDYPPAFAEAGDEGGEERAWSYDDPAPHELDSPDPTTAFTSPAADREDLVPSSGKSGIAALFAWRPSMPGIPSFSFGASGFGMRARDAISVLDSILEENGTEDIPRGLIVGLFAFVGVMALVALVVAIL